MMFLLYSVALLAAAAALFKVYTVVSKIGVPPVLSLCIYAGGLFYLSSLLPGVLSILTPPAVTVSMVLLSILTFWIFSKVPAASTQPARSATDSSERDGLGAILIPAAPALFYYVRLYRPWDHSRTTLSWDTVSYHLPGFVEYYQDRSLYSLNGPYQTYSFGFELIGNFPAYFFQHHWGLFIAHVYAVIFLFAAILIVTRNLLRLAGQTSCTHYRMAYFLAVSLLVWIFHPEIFGLVGKNDIFQGACLLAFFGLLLEISWSVDGIKRDFRLILLLSLSSLALALALATKPTSLAYLPVIPSTLGLLYFAPRSLNVGWSWRRATLCLSASLVAVIALGGFFLLRNLASIGSVVAEDVAQFRFSLLANITNPALHEAQRGSVIFAASMCTPIAFLLPQVPGGSRYWIVRSQAFLFSLTALGAFIVSPWVILPESAGHVRWELRLGIPLFAMMTIAFAILATLFLERFTPAVFSTSQRLLQGKMSRVAERLNLPSSRLNPVASVLLFSILGLLAPVYWSPVRGLPGFESVRGLPSTKIYEWVQSLDRPTRIYAAGLRPYGLYGVRWQNRLFYDLHSSVLLPESSGKARLAAIVSQFHPDLVLISVDPHDDATSNEKPLVNWIRSQKTCFVDVFEDTTVSGFGVRKGCEGKMKAYVSPGMKIRMGR